MKKSRIVRFQSFISILRTISATFDEDRISVYAAQASFFVIISAVPFLSLLFAIVGSIAPAKLEGFAASAQTLLPAAMYEMFANIIAELQTAPAVSLLSISALTTLWSASKGISAIRGGVQTVYHANRRKGFVKNRLPSLVYTLTFIVMIVAVVVILVFGDFLYSLITQKLHFNFGILEKLFRFKTPIFIVFMTLVFTVMYYAVARRSDCVSKNFFKHMPGAVFSSLGWSVFSYFYSLYIHHFPNASYIYGSLAAVCLIMLWLYFCMIILLCGAEINRMYFANAHGRGEDTLGDFFTKSSPNPPQKSL